MPARRQIGRRLRARLPLILATIAVSAALAFVLAYLVETLPSADGPHPLSIHRLVVTGIGFTVLVSLLYAAVIWAMPYWDPRATGWETLIGITLLFASGGIVRALVEAAGVTSESARKAAFAVPAIGSYLLVRWAFRRRVPPPGDDGGSP